MAAIVNRFYEVAAVFNSVTTTFFNDNSSETEEQLKIQYYLQLIFLLKSVWKPNLVVSTHLKPMQFKITFELQ